ncbi:MAG: UDP-N-acetylmuramate--L-alanine ligase [Pseudomonadota bacterium]|nr:UDP-N-acetylmuramate--L-alanine ligase [Pseudomonadota bacterium]
MKNLPISLGIIHFVGIGGIGMSGIAAVLHNVGCKVQGSDISEGGNVHRLKDLGIRIFDKHDTANLQGVELVVVSSAIKSDNPEVEGARQLLLPIIRRAEMLGGLMRLKLSVAVGGTHGKTTTTSMIASLMDSANMDPTVINGGIINAWGSNARVGEGDWMVVEADESDGTFVDLPATIAVVTNIDQEHMDYYGSFDALRSAFNRFVENIPFYGFAVLCIDDPEVQSLNSRISDRKIVTYGKSSQADVQLTRLEPMERGSRFDVSILDRKSGIRRIIKDIFLPMHGSHNVQNSLAVIAIANEIGLSDELLLLSFKEFKGVKRRFTLTGKVDGIRFIDDYGHHPVEISAVLEATRDSSSTGRIVAVLQPHRFSRLKNLFDGFCTCMNKADIVIVAEVYGAGEEPIDGFNKTTLIEGLKSHGHRHVLPLDSFSHLPSLLDNLVSNGDVVLFLGAGDITKVANSLPAELAAIRGCKVEGLS